MAELASAYVSVLLETSRVPGQLRSMFGGVDREATSAGRTAGRSFSSSLGSSLKGLGAAAGVTGGIVAVGGALKSAISSGMDFTTSLNTMQAVAGASADQVAKVGQVARQLGTDNSLAATSSVDAAQAMLELAKGGFTVDQSMQAARGTLQLAAAAQISAGEAATIQSQALQAFGKDASYAGTAADILANAANQSSAEITDVAQALQQGGAVANQFGVNMQDSAATIALLANAGIKGSDAGTLLKSALLALTDTSKPAQGAMKDLGLSVYDAQGNFVGMESLFGQLQVASKRMTPEMYQAATATLFGSDAARLAGVAAQQGAGGFDKLRDAMGQQGAAADVAKAKMQGLPGAWERLKNSAQDAGLAFYDAVKGPLTSAATFGSDAIEKLSDGASAVGPKIAGAFSSVLQAFQGAGGMEAVSEWGDRLGGVFTSVFGSAKALLPVVGSVVEVLGQASTIVAAVGIETFVSALEATSQILSSTVVPVLQLGNSVLSSMQPLVVAAVAAWLGFKLVGPALGALRTQVSSLTTTTTGAAGSVREFARQNTMLSTATTNSQARLMALSGVTQAANGRYQNLTGQFISNAAAQERMAAAGRTALPTMGRFGTAISQLGQSTPAIARMQSSFVTAATGADRFGRTAGAAAAAGTGLRTAGAGVAGLFGGPLGLAFTGAAIGVTYFASQAARSKQTTEALANATKNLAVAQDSLGTSLLKTRGAVTDDTVSSAASAYGQYRDQLKAAEGQHRSWYQISQAHQDDLNDQADAAKKASAAFDKLGISDQQVGQAFSGSAGQYENLRSRLVGMGDAGKEALSGLDGLRANFLQQQDVARRVTPGITELGDAMRIMGDKGASSSDKLNALKAAMDAMNPARNKTEAMAQFGEAVRKAAEAAQGIDGTAFDQAGKLNATTEAGATLSRTLTDLVDKSAQVKSSGGDMGLAFKETEGQLQALATATGQPLEKIRELFNEYGGKTLGILVQTEGTPDTIKDLAKVKAAFDSQPGKKTVTIESDQVNPQTMEYLRSIGAAVTQVPGSKTVTITTNDQASARMTLVTQNLDVLNLKKANPTLDLNTIEFQAKDAVSRGALQQLAGTTTEPKVGAIITDLLNGQAVSMTKLDELSRTVATPQAKMLIDAIMANIKTVNDGLDNITRTRVANIVAKIGPGAGDAPDLAQMTPEQRKALGFADGGIRAYANGGIADLEKYANGGPLRDAKILPGRGAGSLFTTPAGPAVGAEGETVAEAWIPFAKNKRPRAASILATVAKVFGFDLVPQGTLPGTISGFASALGGGALSGLLARTGMDGMRKFADGGVNGVTADDLDRLAKGEGASRPLTGAPYEWSKLNWGDCSAAASAFMRKAAGLDPFGGRTATAGMAAYATKLGFLPGLGPSGSMRIGFYNGGPGGGHATSQLPNGKNAEMGGSNGGGMYGGNAADPAEARFTDKYHRPMAPAWKDAGADPGGFKVTSDGAIEYTAGNGNFGATGGTPSSTATTTGGTSISTRLGSAAGAFIEGQIGSLLSTFSINDSPGVLGAFAEYENQVRSSKSGSGGDAVDGNALKQSYETAKAEADKRYEAEKLRRLQEYQAEQKKLQDEQRATKDAAKRAQLEQKLADLRTKHQNDDLAAKQKHDAANLAAKQKYDEVKKTGASANAAAAAQGAQPGAAVTDPGGALPGKGQDLGAARGGGPASTGSPVKDAFRSGLRPPWQQGQPWSDSDWIVNKESSWNPGARNGKYFGLIQAGPEVYQAAGKSPTTTDPREQGQVFDRYVGERYQDPMKAKAHHVNAGWYERGGVIHEGPNILMNGLGHKETALPFDPRDLKRSLDNGGNPAGSQETVRVLNQIRDLLAKQSRQPAPGPFRSERDYQAEQINRRTNALLAGV